MKTNKFSMAALLRMTMRRHGLGCLAMVGVVMLMHYWRHGTLELADMGHALLALLTFAVISLLIEYNRTVNGTQDSAQR